MLRPLLFVKRRYRKLIPLLVCGHIGAAALALIGLMANTVLRGHWECYLHFEHMSVWGGMQQGKPFELGTTATVKGIPGVQAVLMGRESWYSRKLPLGTERAFVYDVPANDLPILARHLGYRLEAGAWPGEGEIIISAKVAKAYGLAPQERVPSRGGGLTTAAGGAVVSGIMAGPGFLAMRDLQSRAENVLLILSKRGATVPRIPAELSGTVALWRSWPGVEKDLRQKTSFLGWLFFCLGLAVGLPLCVLSAVAMFVSVKEYAAELAVLHVIGLPTGRIFLHTLAGYALPVFIGILAGALTGGGAGYLLIARLITGTGLSPGIYPTTAVAILALFLAMVLVAAAVIWRATAARDPIMAIESGREVLGGLLA